jgi:hypothetical protein
MMDQFKVVYHPGGMTLDHSAWWLCAARYDAMAGVWYEKLVKLPAECRK